MEYAEDAVTQRLRYSTLVIVIVAVWLLVSPFVLGYNHLHGSTWNTLGVAWVAAFIAGLRVTGARDAGWLGWLNVLVGLYLVASPWIWGDGGDMRVVVNQVVCGLIIAAAAAWGALATPTLFARA